MDTPTIISMQILTPMTTGDLNDGLKDKITQPMSIDSDTILNTFNQNKKFGGLLRRNFANLFYWKG